MEFPLLLRVLKASTTVLVELGHLLVPQSEVFLFTLLQYLEGKGGSDQSHLGQWPLLLTLESLQRILSEPQLLASFYTAYDLKEAEEGDCVIKRILEQIAPHCESGTATAVAGLSHLRGRGQCGWSERLHE
ncbi:unnamed protein product, partial [Chrysoparadoxa australica]